MTFPGSEGLFAIHTGSPSLARDRMVFREEWSMCLTSTYRALKVASPQCRMPSE